MGVRYGIWDPLGPQTQGRMSRHDIICYHTMVGSLAGTSAMFHQNGYGGTESHFGVGGDGTVRQWQDTDFVAEANLNGNHRLISIETADYGEPMFGKWNTSGDNVPPWTDAQMRAIAEITARCCQAYNIPIELIPDSRPNRRGVGYHRQGCDPVRVSGGELWSSARGKVCPGARRIAQIPRVIEMARQLAGGGALSPSTPPPMKEPDPVQNFQIAPGAGALRLIVPVNAAGSGVARAWVSAVVNGPTKGLVHYWFQGDDTGISDTAREIGFHDGMSTRFWAEAPSGCTQVNVQYDFPEGGAVCVETVSK